MNQFESNSIFWIEVDKIKPNPYQPRREFDPDRLNDLAESIRQYGVLQPLTVTRKEIIKEDGGIVVEYELIAGERRHRASRIAGLSQVPAIIRSGEENDQIKLELAIIENLQREDINPVERARAFSQLAEQFNLKHTEIAKKVGRSREYVSNSIRLLTLPEHMQQALADGRMTEGHARPIMMLRDKPEEQETLFKEVVYKKLTVREAESIARRVARDKVRKKDLAFDPEIIELEKKFSESLGTRVKIERKDVGGKIVIDFFSPEDIRSFIKILQGTGEVKENSHHLLNKFIDAQENGDNTANTEETSDDDAQTPDIQEIIKEETVGEVRVTPEGVVREEVTVTSVSEYSPEPVVQQAPQHESNVGANIETETDTDIESEEDTATTAEPPQKAQPSPVEKKKEEDEDLYSLANFTI